MGFLDAARSVRNVLRGFGLDIRRFPPLYHDAFSDARDLLGEAATAPILFDIGANEGQTIRKLRSVFPTGVIHSFEPSPSTFRVLSRAFGGAPGIVLNNSGVGSRAGTWELVENELTNMSSFLEPGDAWGAIKGRTPVSVVTLDQYCAERTIANIDFLKIDTQGFDYEVLRGADEILTAHRVSIVLTEITLDRMYKGIARYDAVFTFMADRNYRLVGIYDQNRRNGVLSWADAMFIKASLVD
jgi:FkbM family methyltransferase